MSITNDWLNNMNKEKAERIQRIFNWVRFVILVLFLTFLFIGLSKAQTTNDFGMWITTSTEKDVNDSWSWSYLDC